jgi:hypothetical protein
VAQVWVIGPVEKADTLLDSSPSILGKSDGELDHVGGLRVRQLGVVALVGVDLENVDGHVDRPLANLLGHLDDRYSWMVSANSQTKRKREKAHPNLPAMTVRPYLVLKYLATEMVLVRSSGSGNLASLTSKFSKSSIVHWVGSLVWVVETPTRQKTRRSFFK